MKTIWHQRFLELARHISLWSKDPSTKCGAIIVDEFGTVVSQGYNGFPRGMSDSIERYADRDFKYDHVIHAEMNAIVNAKQAIDGHYLYVWPMLPCIRCAAMVAQTNVKMVIAPKLTDELAERWGDSVLKTKRLFDEAGIEYLELKT